MILALGQYFMTCKFEGFNDRINFVKLLVMLSGLASERLCGFSRCKWLCCRSEEFHDWRCNLSG